MIGRLLEKERAGKREGSVKERRRPLSRSIDVLLGTSTPNISSFERKSGGTGRALVWRCP